MIQNKQDQVAETMEMAESLGLEFLRNYCENILNDTAAGWNKRVNMVLVLLM